MDNSSVRSAVTVMKGKSVALLELDYPIISIIPLYKSPWGSDVQTPGEIFVLLGMTHLIMTQYESYYII